MYSQTQSNTVCYYVTTAKNVQDNCKTILQGGVPIISMDIIITDNIRYRHNRDPLVRKKISLCIL